MLRQKSTSLPSVFVLGCVHRTAENPVLVLVLSDIDLGSAAVSELLTWDEILEQCGPVSLMLARGVVPTMRADVVRMCHPRWSTSQNPLNAFSQWLAEHPAEEDRLYKIRKNGEGHLPWRTTPLSGRIEVLGKVGRLNRRAWLADGLTPEEALRRLDALLPGTGGEPARSVVP